MKEEKECRYCKQGYEVGFLYENTCHCRGSMGPIHSECFFRSHPTGQCGVCKKFVQAEDPSFRLGSIYYGLAYSWAMNLFFQPSTAIYSIALIWAQLTAVVAYTDTRFTKHRKLDFLHPIVNLMETHNVMGWILVGSTLSAFRTNELEWSFLAGMSTFVGTWVYFKVNHKT